MLIEYTEVNGWSINGKPAEEGEVWPILKRDEQREVVNQLTYNKAVKIRI